MSDVAIVTRLLTEDEYAAYFAPGMINVTTSADQVIDIWPYVDAVPIADIGDLGLHDVEFVYDHPNGGCEHVLIATCRENCYLIVLIDRKSAAIIGHHFLDLNLLYGLDQAS